MQVTWRRARTSSVTVTIDGTEHTVEASGPGALEVQGLSPGTTYAVTVHGAARRPVELSATTLEGLPGPERHRIATINDLHLGDDHFGLSGRMVERPQPDKVSSQRCAEAAVDEALAWGAERIIIKGDIVHYGKPHEWDMLGELLHRIPVPVTIVQGNHESRHGATASSAKALASLGHPQDNPLQITELGPLTIAAFDSTVHGEHIGRVGHVHDGLLDAASHGSPLLVLHHHNLQVTPFPTVYPRGAYGGAVRRLLRQLAATNPNVVFASGHTHRHRVRKHYGIPLLELGSTKDYPGTWAGYHVHDGGITQVVRRIARPDVMAWTEYTAEAVLGVWAHYSPGRLNDRCLTLPWS